jgi:hypothetical protein
MQASKGKHVAGVAWVDRVNQLTGPNFTRVIFFQFFFVFIHLIEY